MADTTTLKPCGTYAGARTHYRRGTPECEPCRLAHRDYKRAWYRTKFGKQRRTIERIEDLLEAMPERWFTIRQIQDELNDRFGHRWTIGAIRRNVHRYKHRFHVRRVPGDRNVSTLQVRWRSE